MPETTLNFGDPDEFLGAQQIKDFCASVDAASSRQLASVHDDRDGFQDRLFRDYGAGFEAMDLVYSAAAEAAQWAKIRVHRSMVDDPDEEFEVFYAVLHGCCARALSAYAETAALLRGGFPNGALTRARFLHELLITLGVLAEHGRPDGKHPELINRYLDHRDIFLPSTVKDLLATQVGDVGSVLDEDVLALIDQNHRALLDTYGKSFRQMWGWAAPLFPDWKKAISTRMLGELVFPEGHFFYVLTSEHVHVGSEGLHNVVSTREHESVLLAGATNRDLALPAELATAFLVGIVEYVVPARIEADGVVDDTGASLLVGVRHLSEAVSREMGRGEDTVTNAEAVFQDELRHGLAANRNRRGDALSAALRAAHRLVRRLRRRL